MKKRGFYLKRRSIGSILFDIFNYAFLTLFCITILYPFWNMFLLSFSDQKEAVSLGIRLWNDHWDASAYKYIFEYKDIVQAYCNTILKTVVGTLIALLLCFLAAYPLSKKDLPGRNIITLFFLFTMFFHGGMVPSYLLVKNLGLINSLWALILPVAFSTYNMIIMRNFIMSIDKGLEEAALIDGAGYFNLAFRVILPLLKPVMATIALWTIVSHWNAWFDCMIYITDPDKKVLQLVVRDLVVSVSNASKNIDMMDFNMLNNVQLHSANVTSAAVLITIGPIVLVYPFLQKYFVKGVMVGSLKG